MITDERRISIENMAGEKDDMTVGSLIRSSFDENACGMIIEVSNIQEDGIWQKCKVLWARDIDERKYVKFMIDSIKMKLPSFKLPPLPELKFPDFQDFQRGICHWTRQKYSQSNTEEKKSDK